MSRPLRVFLCHASQDKPAVRKMYAYLKQHGVQPWLDQEDLLPGQNWEVEIPKALVNSDVILVCLSKNSVNREGYFEKEIAFALDKAMEKPQGTIFIIPVKLQECDVHERLKRYQWVDYYRHDGRKRLLMGLNMRVQGLGEDISPLSLERTLKIKSTSSNKEEKDSHQNDDMEIEEKKDSIRVIDIFNIGSKLNIGELSKFIKIHHDPLKKDDAFYIAKYPVTNAQYERFLMSDSFFNIQYWTDFPKIKNDQVVGNWDEDSLSWYKERRPVYPPYMLEDKQPRFWDDPVFGIAKPDHPVVGITWLEANAYCKWLKDNWDNLPESKENLPMIPTEVRLPTRNEWVISAGGDQPGGRFPWDRRNAQTLSGWDQLGELPFILRVAKRFSKRFKMYWTSKVDNIQKRSNVNESGLMRTSSVTNYPLGESPFGIQDMSGNVWEWMADYVDGRFVLSGGSWNDSFFYARVGYKYDKYNFGWKYARTDIGFRVLIK